MSRLLELVQKIDNSGYGAFYAIHEDLGNYIDNIDLGNDPLLQMAYAYARRYAASGLYAQGIVNNEEYSHMLNMFHAYQQRTGHSKEFQIEANDQAKELILSYDPTLDFEILGRLIVKIESEEYPCTKDQNQWFNYENMSEIIPDILNMLDEN